MPYSNDDKRTLLYAFIIKTLTATTVINVNKFIVQLPNISNAYSTNTGLVVLKSFQLNSRAFHYFQQRSKLSQNH